MTPVKSPCCGSGRASSYATFLAFEGRAKVRLPIGTSSIDYFTAYIRAIEDTKVAMVIEKLPIACAFSTPKPPP
jgi:hypothetical protein